MSIPDLVNAFYNRIWNDGDRSALADLLTESFTFRGSLGLQTADREGFWDYVTHVRTALAGYRSEIVECVAEGNKAFARMIFTGRQVGEFRGHRATGMVVRWEGAALFTFAGARISDVWVLGDMLALEHLLQKQSQLSSPALQTGYYDQSMPSSAPLPEPPSDLTFGDVSLVLAAIVPGGTVKKFVPYYYFQIIRTDGQQVGHINFRVGDTPHVEYAAGHIGYEVRGPFRGHGYAYQACRALAPLIRKFYESVLITCDPDNAPSRKTIEKLGAVFLDEHAVPLDDPHYERGSHVKLRFRWTP